MRTSVAVVLVLNVTTSSGAGYNYNYCFCELSDCLLLASIGRLGLWMNVEFRNVFFRKVSLSLICAFGVNIRMIMQTTFHL